MWKSFYPAVQPPGQYSYQKPQFKPASLRVKDIKYSVIFAVISDVFYADTHLFFFFLPFSCSPIRGSTTKTSRTNVPTATVPTQTRRRCRSTCQRTRSKTQRPTAVACVAGRTPQWVNHTQKKLFRRLRDCDLCSVSFREFAIRWWPLMILRSECSLVSCLWYSAAQLSRQSEEELIQVFLDVKHTLTHQNVR